MYMINTVPLTITQNRRKTFTVNIDRYGFERLADSLGLYRPEVLSSLRRAEEDIHAGRVRKVRSLRDLRSKQ